jgi:hypothetical protein
MNGVCFISIEVMSRTAVLDPAYLLVRASQVHRLAEAMTDSWNKNALHEIAHVYELLADERVSDRSRANKHDDCDHYWYWRDPVMVSNLGPRRI